MAREFRVNLLISMGHSLSHFYILCLPPMFLVWQQEFDASFAELGLAIVVLNIVSAALQTPLGFLVDRFGAKPFLIGGTLVMGLAMAAMSLATAYWQILVLGALAGVGIAVFHPADYSILAGSIARERIGRAFALHTFSGNVGFALAPPVIAGLMLFMGWRGAILVAGLAALPVVAAVIWQRDILQDEARRDKKKEGRLTFRDLLFDRTMMLFFMFFMLGAMAGGGIQAWLITVLHQVKGVELALASAALTAYMIGSASGVLLGGWATDAVKSKHRLLGIVIGLTGASALVTFIVGVSPVGGLVAIIMMLVSGLCAGGSRTPRDVMLKDAAPPGEIGKVFGYISASLPLGSALVPVPMGLLIDHGHPELVLVLSAGMLAASLVCIGPARGLIIRRQAAMAAK